MPKRMALTIAGAVSLGSYEAGVTYELLQVLKWHNGRVGQEDKIYIDVITGASAGGMTAAMLGEWLMFYGGAMDSEDANPLYRAWVEKISLKGLMKLGKSEGKWASLCSSDCVTKIGTDMVVPPLEGAPEPGIHACIEPDRPLRIGLALTNLNGVDYQIPITGNVDGGFNYTHSADQRLFVVRRADSTKLKLMTPDGVESDAGWDVLRDAAVACGAFPFAFRPQQLQRNDDEYVTSATPLGPAVVPPDDPGKTYVLPGSGNWSFAYTDGGVLQNQPLGIAKSLVDMVVAERLKEAKSKLTAAQALSPDEAKAADHAVGNVYRDADDRIYVFVSPNAVRNSANGLQASALGLSRILPEVIRVYLRQAAFHDWIMAEQKNRDIRLLDKRAMDLETALTNKKIENVDCFLSSANNLDDLMLEGAKVETLTRLRHQYNQSYARLLSLPEGTKLAQAFVSGIAALEAAAQLHDRDTMNIIAVLADAATELAGSGICAFVGFFSEGFRKHDYWVGRTKARAYFLRNDVCTLLKIDQAALAQEFLAKPVTNLAPGVKPRPAWGTILHAGGGWLLYGLLIRWQIVAVMVGITAVLLGLGALACHFFLHP